MTRPALLYLLLLSTLNACAAPALTRPAPGPQASVVAAARHCSNPQPDAETRAVWSPQGSHAILRDTLGGEGKLLELRSGKLLDDKDYLSFSPDGTQVFYKQRGFSQQPVYGILELGSGRDRALSFELPPTVVAVDHSSVSWTDTETILIGLVTRVGEDTQARIYRFNPRNNEYSLHLFVPAPDPNGFDWRQHQQAYYFTNQGELYARAAGKSTPERIYAAPEGFRAELLAFSDSRIALALTASDSARLIVLDTANGKATEISTSRDELDVFGPAAFSPDGSSLYFSRRHSVGWDERRGRMPFYTAELLSSRQ
ncbi:MAG: hypothetical protein ACAI44_16905, partial [Candidatus Sericytochromatia bacterium]